MIEWKIPERLRHYRKNRLAPKEENLLLSHDFFFFSPVLFRDREKEQKTNLHIPVEAVCDFNCWNGIKLSSTTRCGIWGGLHATFVIPHGSSLCYSSCVTAKEFCVWSCVSFPCPCRLQHHFLNLICAKQSCPIVLASHNWLQLGFLLQTCLLLSCVLPWRESIYLTCALAYTWIQYTTK